jgi:hypothetical protein
VHFAETGRGEIRVASNRRSGRSQIWIARQLRDTSIGSAAIARLRQRDWNCAGGHKQKQVKCTSKKVRFDGRINLSFHIREMSEANLGRYMWSSGLWKDRDGCHKIGR